MSKEKKLLVGEKNSNKQGEISSHSDEASDVELFLKSLTDLMHQSCLSVNLTKAAQVTQPFPKRHIVALNQSYLRKNARNVRVREALLTLENLF